MNQLSKYPWILFFLVLGACSTSPKNESQMVAHQKSENEAVIFQSENIDPYQNWLKKSKEQLAVRQKELDEIIAKTKTAKPSNLNSIEYQNQLLNSMQDTSMLNLRLQTAMEQHNELLTLMSNLQKANSETAKEVLKNIK